MGSRQCFANLIAKGYYRIIPVEKSKTNMAALSGHVGLGN